MGTVRMNVQLEQREQEQSAASHFSMPDSAPQPSAAAKHTPEADEGDELSQSNRE